MLKHVCEETVPYYLKKQVKGRGILGTQNPGLEHFCKQPSQLGPPGGLSSFFVLNMTCGEGVRFHGFQSMSFCLAGLEGLLYVGFTKWTLLSLALG